ncbi:hypothetical protein AGMMS49938_06500 [Fibrobacterales bacterium]|nr:hypothetical protein AGMMS49938_06500 [Fibrobacterales bacterium]
MTEEEKEKYFAEVKYFAEEIFKKYGIICKDCFWHKPEWRYYYSYKVVLEHYLNTHLDYTCYTCSECGKKHSVCPDCLESIFYKYGVLYDSIRTPSIDDYEYYTCSECNKKYSISLHEKGAGDFWSIVFLGIFGKQHWDAFGDFNRYKFMQFYFDVKKEFIIALVYPLLIFICYFYFEIGLAQTYFFMGILASADLWRFVNDKLDKKKYSLECDYANAKIFHYNYTSGKLWMKIFAVVFAVAMILGFIFTNPIILNWMH